MDQREEDLTEEELAEVVIYFSAEVDGEAAAQKHYPDKVLSGENLKAFARIWLEQTLEDLHLVDEPDEYRERCIKAYSDAYTRQIRRLSQARKKE